MYKRQVSVPYHTELILKISGTSGDFGRPSPILDIMQITAEFFFNIGVLGIGDELIQSLLCELHMIRNNGVFLMFQCRCV